MLKLEVEGLEEVASQFKAIEDALNPTGILDEAVAILLSRIKRRFLQELFPDGVNKWKPSLAAQLRAAKGRGGGTLYDTGNLYNSIQEYADGPNSRLIGTDVEYAKYHQDGKGDMFRPFLGINDEDTSLMVGLIVKRLRKATDV